LLVSHIQQIKQLQILEGENWLHIEEGKTLGVDIDACLGRDCDGNLDN
jgi:hypothetical protein